MCQYRQNGLLPAVTDRKVMKKGMVVMNQSTAQTDERTKALQQWRFKEAVEIEHQKQSLREEKRQLEEERRSFEYEKQEFFIKKQVEDRRLEQEKKLFDMKWKILEDELKKLAAEKQQVERQRDFYRYVNEHENMDRETSSNIVKGEMFFCGVDNEDALRKRYKDLIKIYHPDNLYGDTTTLQEINCEYEKLKALYE